MARRQSGQVAGARKGTLNRGGRLKNQAMPRAKKNVPNILQDFKPIKRF